MLDISFTIMWIYLTLLDCRIKNGYNSRFNAMFFYHFKNSRKLSFRIWQSYYKNWDGNEKHMFVRIVKSTWKKNKGEELKGSMILR